MFTFAHFSDPHLGPLPAVAKRDLINKRVLGYINWRRNRGKKLTDNTLTTLLADIKAHAPDHILVTGDLVNLALTPEIDNAALWLKQLGSADDVAVVPGNHDAYVPGALKQAQQAWGAYMQGDPTHQHAHDLYGETEGFPYIRRRGAVAFIGVSSAVATAPFMATGRFDHHQARHLQDLLVQAERESLFRVVMIHHPPIKGMTPRYKRLIGGDRFRSVIQNAGAELVLHGHTHVPSQTSIAGPDAHVPVIGVAAAANQPGGHKPAADYNLFSVSGSSGQWVCKLERRGHVSATSGVQSIATHLLHGA